MPRVVVQIDLKGAFSSQATQRRKRRMGMVMQTQVLKRIESGGDPELKLPELDFPRPGGGKDHPLFNTGTHLHSSISHGHDEGSVWVGSNFKGAAVLQLGTVGKETPGVGRGKLPTIRPVRGKALFIPLTMKATRAVRSTSGYKKNIRYAYVRKKGKLTVDPLVKGKDFILVGKVDIRPRPFLRMTRSDATEVVQAFKEA